MQGKKVFFAVLNWGLGHAVRSIPLIKEMRNMGMEITVASDGLPLKLLRNEFPDLDFTELPSLYIRYANHSKLLWKLSIQSGHLLSWYLRDHRFSKQYFSRYSFDYIISDNRPGIFSPDIPSIYITHQLNVKAGIASQIATFFHRMGYRKFNQIWIPDYKNGPGLGGELSHPLKARNTKYIGPLSELKSSGGEKIFELCIILSGPEPQRSILEKSLLSQSGVISKKVRFIRGVTDELTIKLPDNFTVSNLSSRQEIQEALNQSKVLISRCGYTTLMDLEYLPRPAVLIPTPGQPEQEYLSGNAYVASRYAIQQQNKLDINKGIEEALTKFNAETIPQVFSFHLTSALAELENRNTDRY